MAAEGGNGNGERERMSRETAAAIAALNERVSSVHDRLKEHIQQNRRDTEVIHDRITTKDRETAEALKALGAEIAALSTEIKTAVQPLRDHMNEAKGARALWFLVAAAVGAGLTQLVANLPSWIGGGHG